MTLILNVFVKEIYSNMNENCFQCPLTKKTGQDLQMNYALGDLKTFSVTAHAAFASLPRLAMAADHILLDNRMIHYHAVVELSSII